MATLKIAPDVTGFSIAMPFLVYEAEPRNQEPNPICPDF
jgi:hypothetical protein